MAGRSPRHEHELELKLEQEKMTVTFFDYAKNDIKKPFVCIFAYNINKFCISILRCSERGERANEKSTQKNEWLLHGTPITKYCIYRHPHHPPTTTTTIIAIVIIITLICMTSIRTSCVNRKCLY